MTQQLFACLGIVALLIFMAGFWLGVRAQKADERDQQAREQSHAR